MKPLPSLAFAGLAAILFSSCASMTPRQEVQRAASIIEKDTGIDRGIPPALLRKAKGVAVVRVYKAGFGVSARVGHGVVVAKTDKGWSGPAFIATAGPGFGWQMGGQASDFVLILRTRWAVNAFARGVNLSGGGQASASVGPVGRNLELGITPFAPIYTYSRSRGLYYGASLEGNAFFTRPGANREFYGQDVRAREILSGAVKPPADAQPLLQALPQ